METRKCSGCEERKPISEFYKKGFNKQGIQQYSSRCRQCQAEYHAKYYAVKKPKLPGTRQRAKEFTDADEERLFSAKRGAVSMSISAEIANEACLQLDPKNWPIGVAESIYKQFGMKWSYL
nr:MAG TPA: Meiotic chromosome segregation protein [Caudoviricetes sp.]